MRRLGSGWARHPDREDGATTLEALVAVLILGIVSAAAVAAALSGLRAYRAAGPAASASVRALAFDDGLRKAAGRIRIPWWDRSARGESLAPGLKMGYLEGAKDAFVSIVPTEGGIVITEGEESRRFEGVEYLGARTLPEESGPPRGIAVEYRAGGRTFRTEAVFGSRALGEDGT